MNRNDQNKKKHLGFKKFKFGHKVAIKDDGTALREINYKSHHPLHRNIIK